MHTQKLRPGDKVEYRIATEKASGRQRAHDIVVVERAPEKSYQVNDESHGIVVIERALGVRL